MQVLYDIDFSNLEKALRDLRDEMKGDEGNIVAKSLMKAAYPIWREAQARAPVSKKDVGAFTSVRITKKGTQIMGPKKDQPGTLRKSIKRVRHRNPTKWNELIGIGVFLPRKTTRENPIGAYYAPWVEFGTSKMAAQPFLRPAIEGNKAKAIQIFGAEAGRLIDAAGKRIGRKYETIPNTSKNRMRQKGRR